MDEPLWTERHAPDLEDLPQERARRTLGGAVDDPQNLLVYGPPGVGKTAGVRAMAQKAHNNPDADLIEINIADFFNRTKSEIRNDPRFTNFLQGEIPRVKQLSSDEKEKLSKRYKSDWSKTEMIKHVLTEYAGYAPTTGEYKTLLLDNAEAIREDFQQALRRVMEKYHRNTQFVIATRQPSKLIPPLRSRSLPVPMQRPSTEEVAEVLTSIVEAEDVNHDAEGLEILAAQSNGDLREAILSAQTTAERAGEITFDAAFDVLEDVGLDDRIKEMLNAAEAGEFNDARSELDDLLVDKGLSGREVLEEILSVANKRYDGDKLVEFQRLAGDVDYDLAEGTSDRIQLGQLLAELGREA